MLAEAYHDNPEFQEGAATALRKVRKLARELGITGPFARRIWKRRNIWADRLTRGSRLR